MNKMYGLFLNTYDYYEWSDIHCVSSDANNLLFYIATLLPATKYPFYEDGSEEQIRAKDNEKPHYVIKEVEVV